MRDLELLTFSRLMLDVKNENRRQIEKWGVQDRFPSEWLMFLGEEYGELCEAVAENQFRNGSADDVVKEAIQVATLALKIAEMYKYKEEPISL